MPNGKPDTLPDPAEPFRPDTDGPALHVYDDRSKASQASDSVPGETRVASKKADGRQRHVVERKSRSDRSDGVGIETWIEAPYDPEEV